MLSICDIFYKIFKISKPEVPAFLRTAYQNISERQRKSGKERIEEKREERKSEKRGKERRKEKREKG